MKNILLNWREVKEDRIFNEVDTNDLNRPWKYLKDKLADMEYNLTTLDNKDLLSADKIIFVDEVSLGIPKKNIRNFIKKILGIQIKNNRRKAYEEAISLGLKDKLVLMIWEPAVIDPDNYKKSLFDKFDTVITWNDDLVDNKKFFKFCHPYSDKKNLTEITPFEDKKILVNISMNKKSNHENDLYRERDASIKFFEKKLGNQFDLFGFYWDKPIRKIEVIFPFLRHKYTSYRGACDNKQSVLSKYKFSLCYENIQKENGWITEKIFDCFNAGTIPIYWGAENVTDFIPENTFIDRRKFKNNNELYKFLLSINKDNYNLYIENIKHFLQSDKYKVFLPENFSNTIIKNLKINGL